MFPRSTGLAALLLCAVVVSLPARGEVPSLDHPVTDLADVLEAYEEEALAAELVELREAHAAQVALLLVKTTGELPIEDYAHQVAMAWGGGAKARDDGLVLVLAIADRRSRIEVGYGLEAYLTDGEARQILDGLRPKLKEADYFGALLTAVVELESQLGELGPAPAGEVSSLEDEGSTSWPHLLYLAWMVLAWVLAWVVHAVVGSAGAGKRALAAFGVMGLAALFVWMLAPGAGVGLAWFEVFALNHGFLALGFGVGRPGLLVGLLIFVGLIFGLVATMPALIGEDVDVEDLMILGHMHALFTLIFSLAALGAGSGGGGGGSSSSSSSHSSYSDREWSSGSSSSSSSGGSSGSDWSGGGGSFGGGGASSDW